jgi:hypothetical protein
MAVFHVATNFFYQQQQQRGASLYTVVALPSVVAPPSKFRRILCRHVPQKGQEEADETEMIHRAKSQPKWYLFPYDDTCHMYIHIEAHKAVWLLCCWLLSCVINCSTTITSRLNGQWKVEKLTLLLLRTRSPTRATVSWSIDFSDLAPHGANFLPCSSKGNYPKFPHPPECPVGPSQDSTQ